MSIAAAELEQHRTALTGHCYRMMGSCGGHTPWALIVLELQGDGISRMTSFLDTETLFPMFGLPARPIARTD